MADPHYKVQQAALGLLAVLAKCMTASLSSHLDLLLPKVLQKLTDKKEATRKACSDLLEEVLSHQPQNFESDPESDP